jgi:carboxyl-terminal processing protease
MPRRNFAWLFGIGLVCVFCWAVAQGGIAPPRGPLQFVKGFPGHNQDYEGLSLLIDTLQHVEQSYVHELTPAERRKFMENAINGGLQSLDMHSGYINPREYKQFMKASEGSFGGVGIQITSNRETKRLTVISPIVGTPAYKAGIKPGDEIEKINGESTQGMTQDDAVEKIQGPPGTQVTLTVRHRGSEKTEDKTLTRTIIEVDSVLGDQRDKGQNWDFIVDKQNRIGYIRLVQFSKKSADEMRTALEKLEQQDVRGLVLDLRNDPGGLLEAAVAISNLFLTHGKIVSVEGRNRPPQVYTAMPNLALLPKVPLVVLVNEHSASASEILAAALQDHQRAVIMGERSFGKGSVQNLVSMEGGKSALKLTTAKYLRPSGKNIHRFPDSKDEDEWGVKPDVEVKVSLQEELDYLVARRDRDVVRENNVSAETLDQFGMLVLPVSAAWPLGSPAGSLLAGVEIVAAYQTLPKPPKPFTDKVLDKALDHLRSQIARPATTSK